MSDTKQKPSAGKHGGGNNLAAASSAQGAPVVVTLLPDGRVFLRVFADRRIARRIMKRRGRGEVTDLDIPAAIGLRGVRFELSFNDGPAEAEAATRETWADLELAAAPARGRG